VKYHAFGIEHMHIKSVIPVLQMNSQMPLKQFSSELDRSLLEVVHIAITVWLVAVTNCLITLHATLHTVYIMCYLLNMSHLSLVDFVLLIFLTNRFKDTYLL